MLQESIERPPFCAACGYGWDDDTLRCPRCSWVHSELQLANPTSRLGVNKDSLMERQWHVFRLGADLWTHPSWRPLRFCDCFWHQCARRDVGHDWPIEKYAPVDYYHSAYEPVLFVAAYYDGPLIGVSYFKDRLCEYHGDWAPDGPLPKDVSVHELPGATTEIVTRLFGEFIGPFRRTVSSWPLGSLDKLDVTQFRLPALEDVEKALPRLSASTQGFRMRATFAGDFRDPSTARIRFTEI